MTRGFDDPRLLARLLETSVEPHVTLTGRQFDVHRRPDRAEDFFDRTLEELKDKGLLVQS